ncbi:MAG: hypothetical protein M9920_00645 [Verrucomicrobiae bacterium]|nr:hypothetical protein [Verrucomicrobiae bacterium]
MKKNYHYDLATPGFAVTAWKTETTESRPCDPTRFSPFKFRINVRPGRQPRLVHHGIRKLWKPNFVETITHN